MKKVIKCSIIALLAVWVGISLWMNFAIRYTGQPAEVVQCRRGFLVTETVNISVTHTIAGQACGIDEATGFYLEFDDPVPSGAVVSALIVYNPLNNYEDDFATFIYNIQE